MRLYLLEYIFQEYLNTPLVWTRGNWGVCVEVRVHPGAGGRVRGRILGSGSCGTAQLRCTPHCGPYAIEFSATSKREWDVLSRLRSLECYEFEGGLSLSSGANAVSFCSTIFPFILLAYHRQRT
jgi:hypothetical protein